MTDLIQTEELEQLKEIMEDEFSLLIEMYVGDSKSLIDAMKTALDAQDSEALRIAAHTLKGSSSNMCIPSISDLSNKIETKAKNNDLADIEGIISELKTIHPQVVSVLESF